MRGLVAAATADQRLSCTMEVEHQKKNTVTQLRSASAGSIQ